MKKFKVSAMCAVLCGSMMFSSCIGSFALFNKVKDWNEGVTDSKFVNEVLCPFHRFAESRSSYPTA